MRKIPLFLALRLLFISSILKVKKLSIYLKSFDQKNFKEALPMATKAARKRRSIKRFLQKELKKGKVKRGKAIAAV